MHHSPHFRREFPTRNSFETHRQRIETAERRLWFWCSVGSAFFVGLAIGAAAVGSKF